MINNILPPLSHKEKKVHEEITNKVIRIPLNTNKKEATALLPKVESMLDKLAKKTVIHKNKAANLKSSLAKKVATLK